jgi:hypothetical protein
MLRNLTDQSTQVELLPSKRRVDADVQSGTITGTAVDLKGEGRQMMVLLACGAVGTSGAGTTTPTMLLTIQEAETSGVYTTLHAFSTTSTARLAAVDLRPSRGKNLIRAVVTLATTENIYIDFGAIGIVYNERYRPSNIS